MIRRPPRSTRTDTLCPYTTLFRSEVAARIDVSGDAGRDVGIVGKLAVRLGRLDALDGVAHAVARVDPQAVGIHHFLVGAEAQQVVAERDRKSTRLNSSH